MQELGKLTNIQQKMKRLKTDILVISYTRWVSSGELNTDNGRVFYSGSNDTKYRYGFAIILSKKLLRLVTSFAAMTKRNVTLQLVTTHGKLELIQIHVPTAEKNEEEI